MFAFITVLLVSFCPIASVIPYDNYDAAGSVKTQPQSQELATTISLRTFRLLQGCWKRKPPARARQHSRLLPLADISHIHEPFDMSGWPSPISFRPFPSILHTSGLLGDSDVLSPLEPA